MKWSLLARRRLSDDIGNDVFYECTMLTDIEADHCAWETFVDGFTGDTTACEAECAARDSCWAIQYDEVGGWCDGCHYEQSCLSVDDIAETSGSASFMTRGCFDASSRPSLAIGSLLAPGILSGDSETGDSKNSIH